MAEPRNINQDLKQRNVISQQEISVAKGSESRAYKSILMNSGIKRLVLLWYVFKCLILIWSGFSNSFLGDNKMGKEILTPVSRLSSKRGRHPLWANSYLADSVIASREFELRNVSKLSNEGFHSREPRWVGFILKTLA